jgi:serine/threonine protein kinase
VSGETSKPEEKQSKRPGKQAEDVYFPELDPELFEQPGDSEDTVTPDHTPDPTRETFRRETERIQRDTDRLRDEEEDTAKELEPERVPEDLTEVPTSSDTHRDTAQPARPSGPVAGQSADARAPGWEQSAYRNKGDVGPTRRSGKPPRATNAPKLVPEKDDFAADGEKPDNVAAEEHTTAVPDLPPPSAPGASVQSNRAPKVTGREFTAVNEAAKELARAALAAEIEKEEKRALQNYEPEEGEIPPSPEVAKRFDVILQLGKGGMAVVYLCRDPRRAGRVFAVKDIRAEMKPGMKVEQRVEHEAKLLKGLDHPGIVKVFDLMKFSRGSAIVMEYIDGLPLDHEIGAGRRINWEFGVRILREIGKALQYAHDRGVIHRDIKPDNILWSERHNQMKLVDFGLARIYGQETEVHMTRTGMVVGTPHYMSPEQVSGKPLDQRSDEYSFGATLYYLLTGQRHVEGTNVMDILEQQRSKEIVPPSHMQRDIPAWLSYILGKMMEIKPDDRYPDMNAVLADLDAAEKNPEGFLTNPPRGAVKRYAGRELAPYPAEDTYFGDSGDVYPSSQSPYHQGTTSRAQARHSTFKLSDRADAQLSEVHEVVSEPELGTAQISALLQDISARLDRAESRSVSTGTIVTIVGLSALIVVLAIVAGLLYAHRVGFLG